MHDRHDEYSPEMKLYQRFKALCAELAEDIDPISGKTYRAALSASSPHMVNAAIALLETGNIRSEDWDCYLELALKSGCPDLLEEAVRIMPHNKNLTFSHQIISEIIRTAPVRHIDLAIRSGIVEICLSKQITQAAITRGDAALHDLIISHVNQGGKTFPTRDWFGSMRPKSMEKGAEFLGQLLPAYVKAYPQGSARGMNECALDNRMVHAIAMHIAGARATNDMERQSFSPSNHQVLAAMGNAGTLTDFLKDPLSHYRVRDVFGDLS